MQKTVLVHGCEVRKVGVGPRLSPVVVWRADLWAGVLARAGAGH
jgi:hypothetical protein